MKIIQWTVFFATVMASLSVQAKTYYITDKVLVGVYEEANADSTLLTTLPSGTPLEIIKQSGSFVNIRGPDGSTGWIENAYMIKHKPSQLVVLELTDKQKQADEDLALAQAELRALQDELAKLKNASSNTDQGDEVAALSKQRDELDTQLEDAKEKLATAEKQIAELLAQSASAKNQATNNSVETLQATNAETEQLRAENKKLIATLDSIRGALNMPVESKAGVIESVVQQVNLTWLWLSLILFLVVGFIAGMKWLDWRNLQRHGGFRF